MIGKGKDKGKGTSPEGVIAAYFNYPSDIEALDVDKVLTKELGKLNALIEASGIEVGGSAHPGWAQWQKIEHDQRTHGKSYYWNSVTGEVSWTLPAQVADPVPEPVRGEVGADVGEMELSDGRAVEQPGERVSDGFGGPGVIDDGGVPGLKVLKKKWWLLIFLPLLLLLLL